MNLSKKVALVGTLMLLIVGGNALGDGKGMARWLENYDGLQFPNPCTGEVIELFGDNMLMYRLERDANGSEHLVFKWKMHKLGAVGLSSGTIYKAVGLNFGERSYVTPDWTGNYYFSSHFGYVSRGSLPNWFQKEHYRAVVNANGVLVVEDILSREIECRGKK